MGEKLAALELQARGWTVLGRNFRAPKGGEVDLVCRGGETLEELVFVEVKTRSREDFGRPLEAVGRKKQALLRRGAAEWLKLLRKGRRQAAWEGEEKIPYRFDVVEVILKEGERPKVTLVENVFQER